MRNIYNIENHVDIHNKMTFRVNEKAQHIHISPARQVIVDSDAYAFIYIVEEDGEFSYLHFGEDTWPALLKMLLCGEDPLLSVGEETIELQQFHEELEGLIYNIEGNSNYGEEFVARVETAFQAFLADDEV
ncbi:hypothetical protein [Lysinibacillus odysseyi]|uniref:Uncharacterized protein n=1 Tax=Lysinibacillus odysseyi 34hs-1 = NBRC 100172 TaxID=1220589 RepID=A0A0A3IM32_9BACI|nr:hypothetical protein [Lysinibacillus odysseyi]KGR83858.1 hypothetical protein CD32_14260 [Lysinibacillus odysseyi 34hs-1 = NBRC 100172]